jgi:hypothetical protein
MKNYQPWIYIPFAIIKRDKEAINLVNKWYKEIMEDLKDIKCDKKQRNIGL